MFKVSKSRKSLIALIINLTAIQPAFSQYAKNVKELIGLVGQVKQVIVEDAEIVNKSGKYLEEGRHHFRTTTYDLQGNVIKEDPTSGTEAPPTSGDFRREEPKIKLRYNKLGKVIEELKVLNDGTTIYKRQFRYDLKGRTIEWRFSHLNETTGKLELAGRWFYKR